MPIYPPAELNTGDNPLIAHFDYSRIAGKLTVRARQRGDRFQPLGMNETKKVAQFMMDAKIPKDGAAVSLSSLRRTGLSGLPATVLMNG